MRNVSKSATFLATESVNSAPFKRGETEVQFFWQGKAQNSSPILRCTFLARRSAKLIANFSATMVTSLPSFSLSLCILSLSLSLSPNVPHAQYRKRFRASYNKVAVFFGQGSTCSSSSGSTNVCWSRCKNFHLSKCTAQANFASPLSKPTLTNVSSHNYIPLVFLKCN